MTADNWFAFRQDVVQQLAGDNESFRDGGYGQSGRGQDVFFDNFAGLYGWQLVPIFQGILTSGSL